LRPGIAGLAALRLALHEPARVSALGLVDSTGLGREINPAATAAVSPGLGELGASWAQTPPGAAVRNWSRVVSYFARPSRVPPAWLAEQQQLALAPGFLEATLAAALAQIGPFGEREVLLEELPRLQAPTLVVWGTLDRLLPAHQAHRAAARLKRGSLSLIPDCGHLPHVERPERFVKHLVDFLGEHRP
jgi:2-hydroxy-6-oxonona-2,4-dienedioate hydrolase